MAKQHSAEVKAQVMAALMAGQGISETARQYKLPKATVGHWAKSVEYPSQSNWDAKRARIGELLYENIEAILETNKAILDYARNTPAWLERQSAESLAVFYGVASDKGIRLLEALHPGDDDDEEPPAAE